jgi:hypothetical protein
MYRAGDTRADVVRMDSIGDPDANPTLLLVGINGALTIPVAPLAK